MAKKSNTEVNNKLRELCDIDAKIFEARTRLQEIDGISEELEAELTLQQTKLEQVEQAAQQGTSQQVLEEQRLKDEQLKMVQRRKQLSTVGGAKGAKLMEREIDTATKTIQAMEERAMKALEEADELEEQMSAMKQHVSDIEEKLQEHKSETDDEHSKLTAEVEKDSAARKKILNTLEDRLQRLYERVASRYPGDAVAYSSKGSCRSCYRSLPPQTYNQVLAGNTLLQCPGCARILVASPEALAELEAA